LNFQPNGILNFSFFIFTYLCPFGRKINAAVFFYSTLLFTNPAVGLSIRKSDKNLDKKNGTVL
jgi:hypothetical protein